MRSAIIGLGASVVLGAIGPVACGDNESSEGSPASETGGHNGAAGATASGGAAASGATLPEGGAETGGAALGGGSSTGGAAPTGGRSPTGGNSACPMELVGWATLSGDSVSTTTGGGDVEPVRPTSAQELTDYASDATPRVIEIEGTFSVPRLQVSSNKTLVGIGPDATLNGGIRIRGYADDFISNVIVRNLTVNAAGSDVDGDGVQIHYAHHVWVDHCEVYDAPDGNLDIVHGSNWVTVSWTIFRYSSSAPAPDHRFSNLVGHSDSNAAEDTDRLKTTFHHNWWSERVHERMPRVRFGQVHSYNNYFSATGNNYCIRAGMEAHILSEGNYFDGVSTPHEFNNSDDRSTAHITERDNVYTRTSGSNETGGGGTPFTDPPYWYSMDDQNDVLELVMSCAGPR